MKRIYKVLPVMVMVFYACNDYLDITPKGVIVPTKAEDYRLLLDQIERGVIQNSKGFLYCLSNDQYLSDEVKMTKTNPPYYEEMHINEFLWKDDYSQQEDASTPNWDVMFNQIYTANVVIAEVPDTEGTEALKNQLLAEAKVHRAFAYLLLVNLYAKHYDPATAAADLGLPLLTKAVPAGSLKRASVKEVYDLIIDDLTTSIDALPDFPEYTNRPSKASAYAILARVYLYMGNFDKALEFADKSLAIHDELLDYNTLTESVWTPGIKDFPLGNAHPEVLLAKARDEDNPIEIEPSDAQIALFDTDNDIRYTGVFGLEFLPFLTMIGGGPPGFRLIGPSVPEMMLIKAECLARDGEIKTPIAIVNTLRKHRIATAAFEPLPDPATPAEALAVVKEERRRELFAKGHRWYDIKRYNVYDNANISITKTYGNETVTLAPGDPRWVLPIAQKFIEQNPEIEQNPR